MDLDAPANGAELYVANGERVVLDPPGAERFGTGWRFHWRQLLGAKVALDGCRVRRPGFDAPREGSTKLLFEVTAENAEDDEVVTDTVMVFVAASVDEPAAALPSEAPPEGVLEAELAALRLGTEAQDARPAPASTMSRLLSGLRDFMAKVL